MRRAAGVVLNQLTLFQGESMKLKIVISSNNDAFVEDSRRETGRILRFMAERIESGHCKAPVFDINGNRVGTMEFDESVEK